MASLLGSGIGGGWRSVSEALGLGVPGAVEGCSGSAERVRVSSSKVRMMLGFAIGKMGLDFFL